MCLARPQVAFAMLQRQQQVAAENSLQHGAGRGVSAATRTSSCSAVSWMSRSQAMKRSVSARSPVKVGPPLPAAAAAAAFGSAVGAAATAVPAKVPASATTPAVASGTRVRESRERCRVIGLLLEWLRRRGRAGISSPLCQLELVRFLLVFGRRSPDPMT